ncbi:MAG: hypothetical protein P9L94_06460 [Candidatus Hinthialibacter antarcticus]|nr:hypothetical protein [Candidatus Hinthialibacter antarcticus]
MMTKWLKDSRVQWAAPIMIWVSFLIGMLLTGPGSETIFNLIALFNVSALAAGVVLLASVVLYRSFFLQLTTYLIGLGLCLTFLTH